MLLQRVVAILLIIFIAFSVQIQAQENDELLRYQDPVLEAELNAYLLAPSNPEAENPLALIESIVAKVTERTPIITRVRAQTYYAMDLMVAERDEEAWRLARETLELAERSGVVDAVVEAKATIVTLYYYTNEEQQGLIELERMQSDLEGAQVPRIRYFAHNLAGRMLHGVGDYEGALMHYLSAYEAVRETNDERTVLRRQFLNSSIAYLQADLRDYENALVSAQRAIDTAKSEGLEYDLPDLYLLKGYIEGQMQQSEASIQSHQEAIKWAREFDYPGVVLISMNNIGSSLIDEKEYERARAVLQDALTEAREQQDIYTADLLLFNLGYVDVMTGNVEAGIRAIETQAGKLKPDYTEADYADLLKFIAEAYVEAGMYEKAVEALLEQRELNETLHEREREKTLSELQTRYEANEQAAQIDLLEQRNELQQRVIENNQLQQKLVILFVAVVIMGSILLFQLYRAARRANLKLKQTNKQLEYQSTHDPLTALLNRRSFQDAMQKRNRQSDLPGEHKYPDALLLLDVDFFKQINDKEGHAIGDTVLVELGKRLREISRATDMVIRWGGEEFLLYLREMDPERLAEFTQRVLHVIGETPVQTGGQELQVTVTAGFIPLPFEDISESEMNWEKCLQIADMALYIGKVHGRNQGLGVMGLTVPYEQAKEALEKDLAGAIEKGWVRTVKVDGPSETSR